MSVKGNGVFSFCHPERSEGSRVEVVATSYHTCRMVDGVSGHCYTMYSGEGYRKD